MGARGFRQPGYGDPKGKINSGVMRFLASLALPQKHSVPILGKLYEKL